MDVVSCKSGIRMPTFFFLNSERDASVNPCLLWRYKFLFNYSARTLIQSSWFFNCIN